MIWSAFRKTPSAPDSTSWWDAADAAAANPTADAIERLRRDLVDAAASPDEHERQMEMIDGLADLIAIGARPELPVIDTQHRVIGTDVLHAMAPAHAAATAGSGKLFLTSRRLIFVSGAPRSWEWHRVTEVTRTARDLVVRVRGDEDVVLRCNGYGDALAIRHLASRLCERR